MENVKQNNGKKRRKPTTKADLPREIIEDDRFKDIAHDPKFRPIPKSEAKVQIDQRFGKMFTDKRFKIKATMDKRGRPVNTSSSEDLKRFYHLEESDDSESENDKEKKPTKEKKPDSDDELLDLARGEGNVETSEEDSSDSSEDEEQQMIKQEAEQEVEWDELDKDAPRSEDISKRLAVCNLDWQNLKAQDLFVLMNSFVPEGGVIRAVSIYPSEFGKQRMEEEQRYGPRLKSKNPQALRKYEFDRLKYYYAVVECDSERTANTIYESCDGMEFQTSGAKIDLRFIPDEMDFDRDEITDQCESMPENYEPVEFINSALMLSTCESTFDSEDTRRKKALARIYSKDKKSKRKNAARNDTDLDQMAEHLKTYIASDSENELEQEKANAEKYRKLLQLGDDKNDSESDEVGGDKEITFNPDLNAAVEKARKEKDDREKSSNKTPFQEYLERKKQKKRERRQAEKEKRKKETTFSDDELPEGVDGDDFFKQNVSDQDSDQNDDDQQQDGDKKLQQQQELELLLMDDNDDGQKRKHFSLKKILKNEKPAKKGTSKNQPTADDDFKVDVTDNRFAAIYTDHRFNIDPTDSSFKRTKGMEAVLQEKTKRRKVK